MQIEAFLRKTGLKPWDKKIWKFLVLYHTHLQDKQNSVACLFRQKTPWFPQHLPYTMPVIPNLFGLNFSIYRDLLYLPRNLVSFYLLTSHYITWTFLLQSKTIVLTNTQFLLLIQTNLSSLLYLCFSSHLLFTSLDLLGILFIGIS